jgi:outer membrane protein, heavy metal efflux system
MSKFLLTIKFLTVFGMIVMFLSVVRGQDEKVISDTGLTVENLVESASKNRQDIASARQKMLIAEQKLGQANLRPNPTLNGEYGTARFFGEKESDFSVGISQLFETSGKRSKRVKVAEIELSKAKSEVLTLERQLFAEVRTAYSETLATARLLDLQEKLLAINEDIWRVTNERLKEGDVAPLDVNLVRVEADLLQIEVIKAKGVLQNKLIELKTLIGLNPEDLLQLAPQNDRPPRLDLGLSELTAMALRERADLQTLNLETDLADARINLAKSQSTPNITGSVSYNRQKQNFNFFPPNDFIQRDKSLTFGVSIELPVFNRYKQGVAIASIEKSQTENNRAFLQTQIKRDVAVAYQKYRTAALTLVLYSTKIIPASEDNLKSIRAAYGLGEYTIFEIINQQKRLRENIGGYNESLREYYEALVLLEKAIGTTIPANSLSPTSTILPNNDFVPLDKENLMKSLNTKAVEISKKENRK